MNKYNYQWLRETKLFIAEERDVLRDILNILKLYNIEKDTMTSSCH